MAHGLLFTIVTGRDGTRSDMFSALGAIKRYNATFYTKDDL